MRRLVAASLFVAVSIVPALAGVEKAPARLMVQEHSRLGAYVARDDGFALYSFSGDVRGTAGKAPVINCRGTCLDIWTPYYTTAAPLAAKGARTALIGTVSHDGRLVVTYGGRPLYSYLVDNEPGDTTGHGIESFNGHWRLVSPGGTPIAIE